MGLALILFIFPSLIDKAHEKSTLKRCSLRYVLYSVRDSALKWSDWKTLGTNKLGIDLQYRYNAHEVELLYKGTLKELNISGGSAGYDFPALPNGLNPLTNVEFPIYACAGNNTGKLTLRCFPTSNPNTFTITSHTNLVTAEEYICGRARYTRG